MLDDKIDDNEDVDFKYFILTSNEDVMKSYVVMQRHSLGKNKSEKKIQKKKQNNKLTFSYLNKLNVVLSIWLKCKCLAIEMII